MERDDVREVTRAGYGMASAFVNPSFKDIVELFRKSLAEGMVLILVGECSVEYKGRGVASLEAGSRIIIAKPDGTFLIHAATNVEPINWQPPGSKLDVYIEEDSLVLSSSRRAPYENVTARFTSISLAAVCKLEAKPRFKVEIGEEAIREAILAEPSLIEEGFKPVSIEKPVESGFIDLYGLDRNSRFVVVEIKRVKADMEAVEQLKVYVESLTDRYGSIRGILAAPSITYRAYMKLKELGLEYRKIDIARCIEILTSRRGQQRKLGEYL
ncbi:MAG: endonuclease NucS [Nitrososphaerota archaeon]|nr:endonuclease NucS [Candidatus Bathyarchaeota archaeon]MCX8162923.1 endonuclease NucS [Candidatus Bathyarchaeota archaeon]MDW8061119.1 endonuclease NucS [Nitrososphaerota archaeon]